MNRTANEILQRAIDQINEYGHQWHPVLVKRTVNGSAFDRGLEKEIKALAKAAGFEVYFETKRHNRTTISGYSRISDRAIKDTQVISQRIMWLSKS